MTGRLTLGCLDVSNARDDSSATEPPANGHEQGTEPSGHVLTAQSITFDFDISELLRRRYCGHMHLQAPKLLLERRGDGSMNIDFGEAVPGEQAESADWWTEIQKFVNKIQQTNKQYRKATDKIPEETVEQKANETASQRKSRFHVDYSKRVTYPFQDRPRFVATSLTATGLEINFVDNTQDGQAHGAIPPLKNGQILIENVSDNPSLHNEPIHWTVSGDIDGAPIKLVGILDERRVNGGSQRSSHLQFDFQADGLPIELAQFFAGRSLPLHFDRGTLNIAANATVNDWNELDVLPAFGFRDAAVSPNPGIHSIAGVNPDVFCRAFNELSTLEINDLHVTGTVAHPSVELGNTVTDLVRSSGKAIAKKQIEKGLQMSSEQISQKIDKELGRIGIKGALPPDAEKTIDEVKKGLGDRLKGLPLGEKSGGVRK
jgi:hypothetical protein